MASRTKEYLKGRFENGKFPDEQDFADVIDSAINKQEDVDQVVPDAPAAGHVPSTQAVKGYVAGEVAKVSSREEVGRLEGNLSELAAKVGDIEENVSGTPNSVITHTKTYADSVRETFATQLDIKSGTKLTIQSSSDSAGGTFVLFANGPWSASDKYTLKSSIEVGSTIELTASKDIYDLRINTGGLTAFGELTLTITIHDGKAGLAEKVESIDARVLDIELSSPELPASSVRCGYLTLSTSRIGSAVFNETGIISASDYTAARVYYLPVVEGDVVLVSTSNITGSNRYFYVGYADSEPSIGTEVSDVTKNLVHSLSSVDRLKFESPKDGYMCVYAYASQLPSILAERKQYLDEKLGEVDTRLASVRATIINKGLELVPDNETKSMSSGDVIDSISLWPDRLQRGTSVEFFGKIDTFGTLKIGLGVGNGLSDYYKSWYEIDNDNVTLKKCVSTGGDITSVWVKPHGLTITNFIAINVHKYDFEKARIRIMTAGGDWSWETSSGWTGHHSPCVISDGCSLHDCKLSVNNSYIAKDMWLFGSSYHGVSSSRIMGQLLNLGYGDWLSDSRPGATISQALEDFKKLLHYAVPKIIHVGTFGNGYSDDEFATAFNEFNNICASNGIDAVYSTQPDRLSRGFGTRRQMIVDAGVRFVDYNSAIAVSDYPNTQWIDGYMASDGIHMTELGAKAFAHVFLRDMPEAMAYPTTGSASDEETHDPTE